MNDDFIKKFHFDVMQFTSQQMISEYAIRSAITLDVFKEDVSRHLVAQLTMYCVTKEQNQEKMQGSVSYPSTWWQFFKRRYFPKWWLKKYPVKVTRINYDMMRVFKICPHIETKENATHAEWLEYNTTPARLIP